MIKDLTGKVFGLLTVLGPAESVRNGSGKPMRRWHCICACGKELDVLQLCLTGKNGTRSCGCARAATSRRKAIEGMIGKRFGRLVVIAAEDANRSYSNGTKLVFRCRCDCGNEITVTKRQLTATKGATCSCGCLLAETAIDKLERQNVLGWFDKTMITAISPDRALNKNNTSGVLGVRKKGNRWIAVIGFQRKSIYLGSFASKEDAIRARKDAERKYYAPTIEKYNATKHSNK